MSEIYGAEHLLRLFGKSAVQTDGWELIVAVNFGPFIAYTNIDTESLNILREYINDIMKSFNPGLCQIKLTWY
jgi:mortality factor 4-like protein 1